MDLINEFLLFFVKAKGCICINCLFFVFFNLIAGGAVSSPLSPESYMTQFHVMAIGTQHLLLSLWIEPAKGEY